MPCSIRPYRRFPVQIALAVTAFFMILPLPQAESTESIEPLSMESTEEYRDNKYDYAFQYPTNWTRVNVPAGGPKGEMRILLKGPTCSVSASVERGGPVFTRKQFEELPNQMQIVDAIMNSTVKHVYKYASESVQATKMIIENKELLPSETGIKYSISQRPSTKVSYRSKRLAFTYTHSPKIT